MKVFMRVALAMFALCLFVVSQAVAAPRSYVVLPFQINAPAGYAYLGQAIPQMFSSRLYWKEHFEPISVNATSKAPASEQAVAAEQATLGADYAVWGSVTIIGDDASLDVRVRDAEGKVWPYADNTRVNELIPALQKAADSVNASVFGRASAPAAASPTRVNQMNSNIVVNQTDAQQQVYLNPQFRYEATNSVDSRLRSQTLPFVGLGILVQDFNNDGKNEIIILEEDAVFAYAWENGRLTPKTEYRKPRRLENMNINAIDMDKDGSPEIVVTAVDEGTGEPESYILSYDGAQFTPVLTRIPYFLNVVEVAPSYMPTLLGQKTDQPRLFKPGVYEMAKNGDELITLNRLDLPKGANVFNVVWLPSSDMDGDKLVVLSESEALQVYTLSGARLAETDETYSGSSRGLTIEPNMPGLGKDTLLLKSEYYLPMRMLPVNLDKDNRWELLVNKPISTASQFFERYRFFPQGEIHALYWDGLGLGLQWKTQRIKGSVADFAVADIDNDGIRDLVLCVNTHPGAIGTKSRKTMLLAYPLDIAAVENEPAQ